MLENLKDLLKLDSGIVEINDTIKIIKIADDECDRIVIKFEDVLEEQSIKLETNDIDYILEVMLDEYKTFCKMLGRNQVYRIQKRLED